MVDDRRIICLVKKNPYTTVCQIKNTLQEVGLYVSKSTIKRRLHQSKYRGFTTRCEPLVGPQNRKTRLDFARKHLKKPVQFYGLMRQISTCTRMMGREEYGRLMIRSMLPHLWRMVEVVLWHGHVWLPRELVPLYLLMMWLLTKATGWILECLRLYYLLRFSQMLHNSLDGASNLQHGQKLITSVNHGTADHISTRTPDSHSLSPLIPHVQWHG